MVTFRVLKYMSNPPKPIAIERWVNGKFDSVIAHTDEIPADELEKTAQNLNEIQKIIEENPFAYWALLKSRGISTATIREGFKEAAMSYGFSERAAKAFVDAIDS